MIVHQLFPKIERAVAPVRELLVPVLSSPVLLGVWAVVVGIAVFVLWWDLRANNEALPSLMKGVWTLVVLYSGVFGLAIYWFAGRTQIDNDSLWKRGCRSTAHCYSGCGAGEVLGFVVLVGVLAIDDIVFTTAGTFALAYFFGYALTVGPLIQEGVSGAQAVWDALYSETPSITVMEITAIGTDILLAKDAGITNPLFWGALIFSLSIGYIAALPVNLGLVQFGVKEGMKNPATM